MAKQQLLAAIQPKINRLQGRLQQAHELVLLGTYNIIEDPKVHNGADRGEGGLLTDLRTQYKRLHLEYATCKRQNEDALQILQAELGEIQRKYECLKKVGPRIHFVLVEDQDL